MKRASTFLLGLVALFALATYADAHSRGFVRGAAPVRHPVARFAARVAFRAFVPVGIVPGRAFVGRAFVPVGVGTSFGYGATFNSFGYNAGYAPTLGYGGGYSSSLSTGYGCCGCCGGMAQTFTAPPPCPAPAQTFEAPPPLQAPSCPGRQLSFNNSADYGTDYGTAGVTTGFTSGTTVVATTPAYRAAVVRLARVFRIHHHHAATALRGFKPLARNVARAFRPAARVGRSAFRPAARGARQATRGRGAARALPRRGPARRR